MTEEKRIFLIPLKLQEKPEANRGMSSIFKTFETRTSSTSFFGSLKSIFTWPKWGRNFTKLQNLKEHETQAGYGKICINRKRTLNLN